jgi:hypothetical protein
MVLIRPVLAETLHRRFELKPSTPAYIIVENQIVPRSGVEEG